MGEIVLFQHAAVMKSQISQNGRFMFSKHWCLSKMQSMILMFVFALSFVVIAVDLDFDISDEELIDETSFKVTPQVIEMNYGDEPFVEEKQLVKSKRSVSNCEDIPQNGAYSVYCKRYKSRLLCNQTCIWGFSFPEGRSRMMMCILDEDKWLPTPTFENCKKVNDCDVVLGPGGSCKCISRFMDRGSICEVACREFGSFLELPSKTYNCIGDSLWEPPLPFCMRPDSEYYFKFERPPGWKDRPDYYILAPIELEGEGGVEEAKGTTNATNSTIY